MAPFPVVHLEISGVCNARCPYCAAGSGSQFKGSFMDIDLFRSVLTRLTEAGLAKSDITTLALYNWGEPFLHPGLKDIISIINEYGFKYAFSTNASVIPEIDESFAQNLDMAIISVPGFSQQSYDKIHGFKFPLIRQNIVQLINTLRSSGYKKEIRISYHVYQFNLEEMIMCQQFCQSMGVVFFPMYATILDWWLLIEYLNNTISIEKLKNISRDLFMRHVYDETGRPDQNSCPMISSYLIINEYGTVVTCCNLPNNHPEYSCGNILSDDIPAILHKKASQPVCQECMARGFFSGQLKVPGFYYQLMSV